MPYRLVVLDADNIDTFDDASIAVRVPPEDRCDTRGRMFPAATVRRFALNELSDNSRVVLFVDEDNVVHGVALVTPRSQTEAKIRGLMIPIGPRTVEAITRLLAFLQARGFTSVWGLVGNRRIAEAFAQVPGVTRSGLRLEWNAP